MQWANLVQRVEWQGRAGALHLRGMAEGQGRPWHVVLLGIYGSHDEHLVTDLGDLAALTSKKPFGATVVAAGDWNVNIPASIDEHNPNHHDVAERQAWLDVWRDSRHVDIQAPTRVRSILGGPCAKCAMTMPITRIPVRWATPSCTDHVIAKADDRSEVVSEWLGALADHAYVIAKLNIQARPQTNKKTKWVISDTKGAKNYNASGSWAETWTWPA